MNKLSIEKIKKDFPILSRQINGKPLVYLDNSATTQKPVQVVQSMTDYYLNHNANVSRSAHALAEEATGLYEGAREKVAKFINAAVPEEIIFTKNATDSLNFAATAWGVVNLKEGDKVLMTEAEHNSNLLPWQELAKQTGAVIEFLAIDEEGNVSLNEFKKQLDNKVKAVVIPHVSNVLGTIFPVKEIARAVKGNAPAIVVVDGSQAVGKMEIDVQSLGCDFYAFSAHKMLGPMGVGVLWGKRELLKKLKPVKFGGGMVRDINPQDTKWLDVPYCFEAGTPDVAGAVGLSAAIDYVNNIGLANIRAHDIELNAYALEKLSSIAGLRVLGTKTPQNRLGLVAFWIDGIHAHDVAAVLNGEGIAVRAGQHCAMKLHGSLEIPASVRASYYIYNTKEDIDALEAGIAKAVKILK